MVCTLPSGSPPLRRARGLELALVGEVERGGELLFLILMSKPASFTIAHTRAMVRVEWSASSAWLGPARPLPEEHRARPARFGSARSPYKFDGATPMLERLPVLATCDRARSSGSFARSNVLAERLLPVRALMVMPQ
jgi:hypothetical protein